MRIPFIVTLGVAMALGCGGVSDSDDTDASGPDAPPQPARLSSLAVGNLTLAPSFDPAITEYAVLAPFFLDDVAITAAAPAEHFIRVDDSAVDSGEPSPEINLSLGANAIAVEVVSFGKATTTYTVTISRGREALDYLKASNANASDQFGFAVDVSGDLLAVGAPVEASAAIGVNGDQNDNTLSASGAVYIFNKASGSWVQEAYIKPLVVGASDNFGLRVALDGDTLVVGSTGEDSVATGVNGNANDDTAASSGAAWVFVRGGGGTWSQQAYLKASNSAASDTFGDTVAISGDTIVVSAPLEDSIATGVGGNQIDNTASAAGAVYVFVRSGTTWTQQAYIKASNTAASDLFGQSVAIDGDTLVVGADGEDSASTGVNGVETSDAAASAGAAYVFVRSGVVWTQQAYLKASNTEISDVFGRSVAISGDIIAVSAEGEDSSATGINGNQADNGAASSGAVYVYERIAGDWTQAAYLKSSNTAGSDVFGYQLALSEDGTLVVAARFEDSAAAGLDGNQSDNGAANAGAAYTFRRVGDGWRQTNYLKASAPGPSDEFGFAVGISNGTVVIGARGEDSASMGLGGDEADNTASLSGAAYVFE